MAVITIPLFKVFTTPAVADKLAPVLASGQLATGTQVAAFESRLANWLGAPAVTALSDGSAAIQLALQMAGVGPDDEVLVSPIACVASLMPILQRQAKPRWADIDPETGMLTPATIRAAMTDRTRAMLHVQWSGDPGDVQAVAAVAREQGIACIVDATEAFGAERDGRRWVDDADFTAYSFYASKTLTTGEGGALICADADNNQRARRLRRFGVDRTSQRRADGDLDATQDIVEGGLCAGLHELPATLGLAAMDHVDSLLARHRDNSAWFDSALAQVPGVKLLRRNLRSRSACWTYSLRVERRDALIRKLADAGIASQRLHLRGDGFSCFGGQPEALPGVATFDAENLSIPCGWWVDAAAREHIAAVIRGGW